MSIRFNRRQFIAAATAASVPLAWSSPLAAQDKTAPKRRIFAGGKVVEEAVPAEFLGRKP